MAALHDLVYYYNMELVYSNRTKDIFSLWFVLIYGNRLSVSLSLFWLLNSIICCPTLSWFASAV